MAIYATEIVKQVRFRESKVQEEIPNFKYDGQRRRPWKKDIWEKIWRRWEGYISYIQLIWKPGNCKLKTCLVYTPKDIKKEIKHAYDMPKHIM